MTKLKIGAFPRLDHYGPEAVRLGEALAGARCEREDAVAEDRRLALDAGKSAEASDLAAADEAFRAGHAMPPADEHTDAYRASVVLAGARLRAARAAEAEADAALYAELAANIDRAAESADAALTGAADDHREAIAALVASRAALLQAEQDRRYVDGVSNAIDYEAGRRDRYETSRPEFVYPLAPTGRPHLRIGNRVIHMGNGHLQDIDKGIAALHEEIPLVFIRPESDHSPADLPTPTEGAGQAEAAPKPSGGDDRFSSDRVGRPTTRTRTPT